MERVKGLTRRFRTLLGLSGLSLACFAFSGCEPMNGLEARLAFGIDKTPNASDSKKDESKDSPKDSKDPGQDPWKNHGEDQGKDSQKKDHDWDHGPVGDFEPSKPDSKMPQQKGPDSSGPVSGPVNDPIQEPIEEDQPWDSEQASAGQEAIVGERCETDPSEGRPRELCVALKWVNFQAPSHGETLLEELEILRSLDEINRIWGQCGISFQIDRYQEVEPRQHQLRYRTAEFWELQRIRKTFQTPSEMLIVITGPWDRRGSIGRSWANAWTSMPGEDVHGAVLERSVATNPRIIAHELGHYLSLGHAEANADLMSPIIYRNSLKLSTEQCRSARWAVRQFWKKTLRFKTRDQNP